MIGDPTAPRCVAFWRCWGRTEGKQLFRKAAWAICSDATKNTLAMREDLHQTRSGVT